MSLRTAIEKNEIIHYYQFHSIKQTVQKYNISRQTVYRYAKQGTFPEIQSNRKQKVKWKTCFTENEEKELLCSLLEFNMAGRKRNVITPSYSNLYGENGIYYGKRSYAAICKKARKLLELAHATKRKNNKKKTERKKYHGAKEPGTIQIDKLCIPESCYSGITTSIVALAEAKEELILKENKLFEETKEYCRAQMALNPGFQRMYSFLLQEWTKQHVENIEKINCMGPRDILEKRFYQYTAVDEYSRWTFRMIYDTQCEFSALQFIRRLHMAAPFQIKKVQTDNGSEFTSKYLKNHGPDYLTCFESYLLSADIRYYQIPKGKPWHNGRVECTHRLDRERFYNRLEIKSLDQANHELEIYNIEFNQYPRKCMKWKNATTMVQEYNKELLCKEC